MTMEFADTDVPLVKNFNDLLIYSFSSSAIIMSSSTSSTLAYDQIPAKLIIFLPITHH